MTDIMTAEEVRKAIAKWSTNYLGHATKKDGEG